MLAPSDDHKFNDDLLLHEEDRKLASIKYPTIFHVLDHPQLRQLFSKYDVPANRAKRSAKPISTPTSRILSGWSRHSELRSRSWGGPKAVMCRSSFAGDADRIGKLAKELIELRPDVILSQTTPVTAALARETQSISIVFLTVSDPIGSGFAASLAHPGGNITGFSVDDIALGSKWMELLKEIAPRTERVTLLFNPFGPPLQSALPSIQAAASSLHIQLSTATVYSKGEIENVVAAQGGDPAGGLIVMPSTFNTTNRELIIATTAQDRVPAIYVSGYFAQSGGLISYGPNYPAQARQAAGYIDDILRGTKPSDLPVQTPTDFELKINLKTAKALAYKFRISYLHLPTS